ncbi:MAG: hypothetical protein U9O20_00405 [Patescibacteria group bacterium]|nr:hypothetical protein [Patescibacteria group bacterium]
MLVTWNGGSIVDSQHFVAEIVGRYKLGRRGYPVIVLTTDTSILTAWTNDYEYDTVFERRIEALGEEKDVFLEFQLVVIQKVLF